MRKYELTLVLGAKTTSAKKKTVSDKVIKLVETFKGKVGTPETWEKENAGHFMLIPVELEAESVNGLITKLKEEEEIERYLLVRK